MIQYTMKIYHRMVIITIVYLTNFTLKIIFIKYYILHLSVPSFLFCIISYIYVPSFDSIFFFYNLLEAGTAGVMEAPLNGNGGLSIKAGGGGDVDGYNAWGATGPPACH